MSDDEIETVSRGICAALGLDPEERIGCGAYDDETPAERQQRFGDSDTAFVPCVMLYLPRWRLYRWKAAEALAVQTALANRAKP